MLNEVLKDFIGAVELVLGALIANRGPVDKSLVINQICVDAATVSTRRITAETPKILQRSEPPLPLPFWILRLVAIRRFARPVVQDFRGLRENAVGKDRICRQANRRLRRRSTDGRRRVR